MLFYDENQRSHWAVIEETTTQSVDEETQEPITLYEYSYKLLDEASEVVANPTLSGDEATLNGLEVDGTIYKVGEKLYLHKIRIKKSNITDTSFATIGFNLHLLYSIVTSSNKPIEFDTFMNITHFDTVGEHYGMNVTGDITISNNLRALNSFCSYSTNNRAKISYIDSDAVLIYTSCVFNSVDIFEDTVTEV